MYNPAIFKPFKLKTTSGTLPAFYGNCQINIAGISFDNLNRRNKLDTPFEITKIYNYNDTNKIIKLKATAHVLSINADLLFNDDTPETVEIEAGWTLSNTGIVQIIPNLNNPQVFNGFNSFIQTIKNKPLKKTLSAIWYNITHGNTPYSNADYRSQIINIFAMDSNQLNYALKTDSYPTAFNNYPHNSLVFFSGANAINRMNIPLFFYQNESLCRFIRNGEPNNTLPCYGISLDTNNTIYFYWTTYKGV